MKVSVTSIRVLKVSRHNRGKELFRVVFPKPISIPGAIYRLEAEIKTNNEVKK